MHRKKRFLIQIIFSLAVCCCALAGCGRGTAEQMPEYYEVWSEQKTLFGAGKNVDNEVFLGMRYYQGEPVKLVELRNEDGNSIYIIRADKSQELLLENVENGSIMEWFPDGEGAVYGWKRTWVLKENEERFLIKYSSAGEEIHRWSLGEKTILQDMCRLRDGRIALLLQDEEDGTDKLGEAEQGKDTVALLDGISLDRSTGGRHVSAGEEGVLVLDTGISGGISEISMEDGRRIRNMAFSGISGMTFFPGMELKEKDLKEMAIEDFRMRENGMIELLWANSINGQGIQENLILSKIERNFIRLRTFAASSWLQERIVEFNLSDTEYYILLEELPKGMDRNDYAARTSVQLAAGKGPDILYGEILHKDCFRGMTEKGIFEDLAPLLEQSGIKEEDYFPFAFQYWREEGRIYTICAAGYPYCYYVDASILEQAEEPGIEVLVEALLSYPEEAYFELMTRDQVLNFFLRGSNDFWGMIDWETGSCDFKNDLFAGMLEAAGRYSCGEGEITGVPEQPFLAGISAGNNLYAFDSSGEMEEQGRVMAGLQFDDGCHAVIMASDLAIVHGDSLQKEGAWKFLSYLLKEDTQLTIRNRETGSWSEVPSNRAALTAVIREDLAWMEESGREKLVQSILRFPGGEELVLVNKCYKAEDVTEERIAEYTKFLEEARAFPGDMDQLLDIVCEETAYYFDGAKSFEETAEIINNRVGLYIKEQNVTF